MQRVDGERGESKAPALCCRFDNSPLNGGPQERGVVLNGKTIVARRANTFCRSAASTMGAASKPPGRDGQAVR